MTVHGQEPTKDEWIAAFRSVNTKKTLDQLTKNYIEVRDGKFQNKRERQAKLDKAKNDLIAEKRRLWANKDVRYPEVDVYSLRKGDLGLIVTSLSDLTNRPALQSGASFEVGSAESAAYMAQMQELGTKVQSYRVLQVLSSKEFLCSCGKTTILVAGMDTSDMRDGKQIERLGPMYCVGNATYPTKNGTNTVMKVVPISNQVADRLIAETKSDLTEDRVRTWTDVTGKFKIEAELLNFDGKKVTLKKTDGSESDLPLSKLSKADREYVEDVLGAPEK